MTHWRRKSQAVIVAALRDGRAKGLEGKALEKHVSAAYPFGERAMWPYKIWLDEFSRLVRGSKRATGRKSAGPKLLGEWPGLTDEQKQELGV